MRASSSCRRVTRCLTGSESGRSCTRPHIASAACSAVSGVARRRISSTSASSRRSIFSSAVPSPRGGNGTPRRCSSQAPLTMAKRLRRAIASDMRPRVCQTGGSGSIVVSPPGRATTGWHKKHRHGDLRADRALYAHSCMRTFSRLLGFLRPYRAGMVWSLVLASFAMVGTAALPWLTGRAIDQVQQGDRAGLRLVAGGIVAAALGRLALSVARRLIAGRVSLGVEVDMRNRLYSHLLALDMGFFDNQQTGQLMSRATSDLQSVRFFLGYGLVFITQSALTILLAAAAMIVLKPGLGLLALIPAPFVIAIAFRYGRVSRPALQEVQQRLAELTADAEENISGVRVVKAFAREERQLARFRQTAQRVFDQNLIATRQRAFYNPL